MNRVQPGAIDPASLIPDFCRGEAIASLAFAMELVAICFTLASPPSGDAVLTRLLLLSLFLQWIGLCSAAALCLLRRRFVVTRPQVLFAVSWATLVLVVIALSALAWRLGDTLGIGLLPNDETVTSFVLRNGCLAAIVALLLLRYFWTRQQWRDQVRAESDARFQALTARIRPHFLFNALNSLAQLIATRPAQAEHLVEDLADVLRASLEDPRRRVTLSEELEACGAYLRIEQARLGERLSVSWLIPEALRSWPVPRLALQPLVENAVHHGVSRITEGGAVVIEASADSGTLTLEVTNPVPAHALPSEGLGLATINIANRLSLIYGDRARLDAGLQGRTFVARLTLPAQALAE